MAQADLKNDEELKVILGKLSSLSDKVAAAKAQVLARRAQASKES